MVCLDCNLKNKAPYICACKETKWSLEQDNCCPEKKVTHSGHGQPHATVNEWKKSQIQGTYMYIKIIKQQGMTLALYFHHKCLDFM
jgi:hypothetical protein